MTELEGHVKSLHHITVGVAGAQDDVSFVQDVLGQRFLKATVLFDGRRPSITSTTATASAAAARSSRRSRGARSA